MAEIVRLLFAYGTLRHPELLAAVLGRAFASEAALPAFAEGFRTVAHPGRSYPALIEAPGQKATGLLLKGLSAVDLKILDAFEGKEYRRRRISVTAGHGLVAADVYWPVAEIDPAAPDWHFHAWREQHAGAMVLAEGASARLVRERLA